MRKMKSPRECDGVRIRLAEECDATALARLSGQLGYPSTQDQIRDRLRRLAPSARDSVFVAEADDGSVIGWVHVSANHLLETGTRAEINGLVVDEAQRSLGAGKRLLDEAERWAQAQGCESVNLRSNVVRERAHGFYLRNGYEHYKTQKAFRKKL